MANKISLCRQKNKKKSLNFQFFFQILLLRWRVRFNSRSAPPIVGGTMIVICKQWWEQRMNSTHEKYARHFWLNFLKSSRLFVDGTDLKKFKENNLALIFIFMISLTFKTFSLLKHYTRQFPRQWILNWAGHVSVIADAAAAAVPHYLAFPLIDRPWFFFIVFLCWQPPDQQQQQQTQHSTVCKYIK